MAYTMSTFSSTWNSLLIFVGCNSNGYAYKDIFSLDWLTRRQKERTFVNGQALPDIASLMRALKWHKQFHFEGVMLLSVT